MKEIWKEGLSMAARWLALGLELLHWGGSAFAVALLVLSQVQGPRLAQALEQGQPIWGVEMKTYGFEMMIVYGGQVDLRAVACFAAGGAIILALMAMVFRNIRLILKLAGGQEGVFQPDIVRMVREIGIFQIAVPVVGLICSTLARLLLTPEHCETSVQLGGFFTGLIVLYLSQVFAQGVRLQQDVDGLI